MFNSNCYLKKLVCLSLSLIVSSACTQQTSKPVDEENASITESNKDETSAYTWLQFARDDQALIRCVIELSGDEINKTPFFISNDGVKKDLTLRFDGSLYRTESQILTDELMFPVKVWEQKIARDSFGTITSHCANKVVQWTFPDFTQEDIPTFYVLGDTGCKPKSQKCDVKEAVDRVSLKSKWLLPDIVSQIEPFDSSFGIHVGDYVYQGKNGFNALLSETAGWSEWEGDFFHPMDPLLRKIPWLMVRGNHETYTSNSGLGYWIFLDDRMKETENNPDETEEQGISGLYSKVPNKQIIRQPWSMPFSKNVTAIILDTAWTNLYQSDLENTEDKLEQYYKNHVAQLEEMTRDIDQDYWLISHVPLFGLNEDGDKVTQSNLRQDRYEMMEVATVELPCAEVTKLEEIRTYLSECQTALERVEMPRGGLRWQDHSEDLLAHFRAIYDGSEKTAEDRLLWDKQRNAILLHGIHQQLSLEFHEELNAVRSAYGTACEVLSIEQDDISAKIRGLEKAAADREARDLLKQQRRQAQELLQEKKAQEREEARLREKAREVASVFEKEGEVLDEVETVQACVVAVDPSQALAAPAAKKKKKKKKKKGSAALDPEAVDPEAVDPEMAFLEECLAQQKVDQEEQLSKACDGAVLAWLQEAEKKDPLIAQKLTQLILAPGRLDGIGHFVTSGTSVTLACEMAIIEQMIEDCTFSGSKEVNYFDLFFNVVNKKAFDDSADLTLSKFLEFVSRSSDGLADFALALRYRLPKDFVARCFFGTGIKQSGKKKADSCLSLISYLKTQDASLAVIETQRAVEILFEGIKSDFFNLRSQIAVCPDKPILLLYLNKMTMIKIWTYLLSEPSDWEVLGTDGLPGDLTFFLERFCIDLPPKDHPIIAALETFLRWKPEMSKQVCADLPDSQREMLMAYYPGFFIQKKSEEHTAYIELMNIPKESILDLGTNEQRCKDLGQKLFDFYKDSLGGARALDKVRAVVERIRLEDPVRARSVERALNGIGEAEHQWFG